MFLIYVLIYPSACSLEEEHKTEVSNESTGLIEDSSNCGLE